MNIEKKFPSGAIVISDIVDGRRVERVYFGYSKKESMRQFRQEMEVKSR